jgi:hypothetical protein
MRMVLLAACLYKAAQRPTFLRLAPLCRFPACSTRICSKRLKGRVFKLFDFIPRRGAESEAMA